MKKKLLIALLSFFLFTKTFATWSIIIIDPKTGEIGIVGASCSYNCYGIGEIIPGRGAVIVQAMSNSDAREKGIEMIFTDAKPEDIIKAMRDPMFDPEKQQYAVVTVKYIGKPATYTGDSAHKYNGSITANGISVQGNTLTHENELQLIFDAVVKAQKQSLPLSEILMKALEAGSDAGGDKRCGEQRATSAFIIIAKPNDKKPYLNLNIFGQGKGGQNAVSMLRNKFEKWKKKHE